MSRVRENRMHGSMWRREETGTSRASTCRAEPGASRRPDRVEVSERTPPLGLQAGVTERRARPAPGGVHVGRVAGDYEFDPTPAIAELCHQRRIKWVGKLAWNSLPVDVRRSISSPMPLYLPARQESLTR